MPTSNESSAATSYFTDCCMAIIDGNFMAPRCGLKLGHEGPHEPIKAGTQTVSDSPAASTACAELLEEVTQLRDDLATYVLSGERTMWTLPMVLDELCRILADEVPDDT